MIKRIFARTLPVTIAALLICTTTFGAEPVNIDEYARRSLAERPAATAAAKVELARVQKSKPKRGSETEKASEVKRLEKIVADLENPLEPYYGSASIQPERVDVKSVQTSPLLVGNPELLPALLRNSEKLNLNNAIRNWACNLGNVGRLPDFYVPVFQVIDATNVIVGVNEANLFWVAGVPTDGFVDGEEVKVRGFLAVSGTRTYQTGGGSNTLHAIEAVDLSEHAEKFTRKSELRTWTTTIDGHETEAIFVRTEKRITTLMKIDGTTIEVELVKLSDPDREYTRKYVSEQAKLAKSAMRRR